VWKAAAKLKLLEYGLLKAANDLDDLNFGDQKGQDTDNATKGAAENLKNSFDQYVKNKLSNAPSARGAYKDDSIYQARKQVIDQFIKTALSSSKRCSRPECGA
jgi:hypothetical protein